MKELQNKQKDQEKEIQTTLANLKDDYINVDQKVSLYKSEAENSLKNYAVENKGTFENVIFLFVSFVG